MADFFAMNYEEMKWDFSKSDDAEDRPVETEADASRSMLSRDGAVTFITDSVEAGAETPESAEVDDLAGARSRAEFVGMDSFIYTVVDDGSAVSGMIWSIETDDFAGLSDGGETGLNDVDMSLTTAEFWDSASDWFLA